MQWNDLAQEDCSVARTLAVIGDRWTLLILRECFLRRRRFDEFHERLEISRPILSDRLQKLTDAGVLTRMAYRQNPTRFEYRLTEKGLELYPIVMAIVHWGDVHLSGKEGPPVHHRHVTCGQLFNPLTVCSECREPLTARDVQVEPKRAAEVQHRLGSFMPKSS